MERWAPLSEATQNEVSASTDNEQLAYARKKYESRLDEECPAGFGNGGSTEAINNSVLALEFRKRQAYNFSNKEFDARYPLGWSAGVAVVVPADMAVKIAAAGVRGRANPGRGRPQRGGAAIQAADEA
jgi:hypothetical protein